MALEIEEDDLRPHEERDAVAELLVVAEAEPVAVVGVGRRFVALVDVGRELDRFTR
jgi:hypothetical protein